ncbi:hypothetical protein K7432_000126 [Basidiobolus ranarum]|uniref:Cyclin N-terminal domain-containing protein n=1 Tax=Basidiobolus ranarum TaxID=34480 RepID=A0ABR2X536_9FUNG
MRGQDKTQRKERHRGQSLKDREEALKMYTSQISDPLGEYRLFMQRLRSNGAATEDYTHIPRNLIDLAVVLIASIVARDSFLLPRTRSIGDPINHSIRINHTARKFIRKVLGLTQLSCTSLILSLFFAVRLQRESNQVYQTYRKSKHRFYSTCGKKQSSDMSELDKTEGWTTISMFLASVIVADKYLSDITYTNKDWVDFTRGKYTLLEINEMERRFLSQLNYKLYITEEMYEAFLSYIEVALSLNQIAGRDTLTYKDLSLLSQSLLPEYVTRLDLSLRPLDAIVLMSKMLSIVCLCYVAVVGILVGVIANCLYGDSIQNCSINSHPMSSRSSLNHSYSSHQQPFVTKQSLICTLNNLSVPSRALDKHTIFEYLFSL